jgi:hypothetical protein
MNNKDKVFGFFFVQKNALLPNNVCWQNSEAVNELKRALKSLSKIGFNLRQIEDPDINL